VLWPAFNVVRHQWADLVSVNQLSVDDVLDACDVLEAIAEAEASK
jgi:hypothetical protein